MSDPACPKCRRPLLMRRDGSGMFCPRCDAVPPRRQVLGKVYGRKVA